MTATCLNAFLHDAPVEVCSRCGRMIYRYAEVYWDVIGIMYGLKDEPLLISYNCVCGTTLSVRYGEAPPEIQRAGENVELLRAMIAAEMPAAGMEA